ncbi:hypothetical protein SWPG_00195 [Synechococcus phage S-CBM2]|nr:hypothetical protein SWPG_00195 [Synechococcus phage S-CBM2]
MYQVLFQRGDRHPNHDSLYRTEFEAQQRVQELEEVFLLLKSSDARVWIEYQERDQGV